MNLFMPEQLITEDQQIEKDYDRMRQMCPVHRTSFYEMIEDVCDRLEYEGSFLYDEVPDQTTIRHLTDRIRESMSDSEAPSLEEFIHIVLCNELLHRRCRYYRKKKMFPKSF